MLRRRAATVACALLPMSVLLAAPAQASTTSNEIVYTVDSDGDGAYALVLQDLESRRVTTLLAANATTGFTYDDPELSPTGARVVLATDYTGSATSEPLPVPGLAVINRDGSGFQRLTTPPTGAIDTFAAWAPDDDTIVFTRVTGAADGSVSSALHTVKVSTKVITPVTGGAGAFTADFNPRDPGEIVFAAPTNLETGVGPLHVMRLDGTGKRALGATGALPAWSPDGALIAYATVTDDDTSSTDADVAQIATVPATGGTPNVFASTRPSAARTVAEYPAWAPDGESILFDLYAYTADGQEQNGDLWAVDRAGVRAGRFAGGAGDEAQVHAQGPPPSAVAPGTPSRFTPIDPKRILDTRAGLGAARAKVGPQSQIEIQVTGTVPTAGGGTVTIPANATAVVLNVTVTNTTAVTDIRVFPGGSRVPGSSNLNAPARQTVPNLVTATLSSTGRVALYNSGGSVDLIADVAGYYTPDTSGAGFTAIEPRRVLDTRGAPDGPVGVPASAPVAAGSPIDVRVRGEGIPTAGGGTVSIPSDATAVVLNVTATSASAFTDVRVYPTPADGTTKPEVSNLNLTRGQTTPNLVTVAIGTGGKVRLANASGTVHLIADVAGYYSAASPGRYVPVVPLRFLDTRAGVGAAATPIPNGGYDDLKLAGTRGVPATALAAVLNLTATSVGSLSDVRAYPKSNAAPPVVSNLNPAQGSTRANAAIVKPGEDGRVRLLVRGGPLHLIGDLAGYFI